MSLENTDRVHEEWGLALEEDLELSLKGRQDGADQGHIKGLLNGPLLVQEMIHFQSCIAGL